MCYEVNRSKVLSFSEHFLTLQCSWTKTAIKWAGSCDPHSPSCLCPQLSLLPWSSMGTAQPPSSFPHNIVVGRKELTAGQEISPISQIWLLRWQHGPGCQSPCISPWEGRSHPVPALTPCKYTHTLTSKAHTISLSLQGVQGNPLQLLKDWKHKKGFYKSFNHRTAIAWLGLPCRVKAMGDTWPECLYVCPRAVARDFKGIRNASEGCMCHFKYVHVSGLSSSFPEGSVWKSICFIFRLCLWVFLSPGEAVGGLCHSLSALFCL